MGYSAGSASLCGSLARFYSLKPLPLNLSTVNRGPIIVMLRRSERPTLPEISGSFATLQNPKVRSALLEVRNQFPELIQRYDSVVLDSLLLYFRQQVADFVVREADSELIQRVFD